MRNLYFKLTCTLFMLCCVLTASAITVSDLEGRYALTAKASLNKGENGYKPSSDITVYASESGINIFGLFGKNMEVTGQYDADAKTITIPITPADMTIPTSSAAMASIIYIGAGSSNELDQTGSIVLNVADDGTISTDQQIVVAAFDYSSFSFAVLETIDGFTTTKKTVPEYTTAALEGTYSYKPAMDIEIGSDYTDLAKAFKTTDLTFTLKAVTDSTFTVSGLFGTTGTLSAKLLKKQGQIMFENSSYNTDNGDVYADANGTYKIMEMLANTRFDIAADSTLTTNGSMLLGFTAGDESDYEDGNVLVNRNGGKATKIKTTNGISSVTRTFAGEEAVYTLDGKLLRKVRKGQSFTMPRGLYIVKGQNGTRKVLM